MLPWDERMGLNGVLISPYDLKHGSPKEGDMIALNASDFDDRWLVAKDFFEQAYEEVEGHTVISESDFYNTPETL